MTTVRQRKRVSTSEQTHNIDKTSKPNVKGSSGPSAWSLCCYIVGASLALCLGLLTSYYVATLHENDLWFSSIKVRDKPPVQITALCQPLPTMLTMVFMALSGRIDNHRLLRFPVQ
ncbi:hypothetical protein GDO78_015422 [Eleutherodactylus coqui]|uniref:Uncharacterized protein n=1 Tax=Eleutherodactylus coqui TaxID=57060 RepID=A0A8J6BEY1_ELECQ|nr:hypothetical protein GDO78_015422 [Eleutherodactylus coqui]